jgi:hypothetical protein
MRSLTDVGELAVVLELDMEPAAVDLTRDGLGDACLDAMVEGMHASHRAQRAPDGAPWAPLKAATVRQKGHVVIGRGSGLLPNPQRWRTVPRDITSRFALVRPEHWANGRWVRGPCAGVPRREPSDGLAGASDPGMDAGSAGDVPPSDGVCRLRDESERPSLSRPFD